MTRRLKYMPRGCCCSTCVHGQFPELLETMDGPPSPNWVGDPPFLVYDAGTLKFEDPGPAINEVACYLQLGFTDDIDFAIRVGVGASSWDGTNRSFGIWHPTAGPFGVPVKYWTLTQFSGLGTWEYHTPDTSGFAGSGASDNHDLAIEFTKSGGSWTVDYIVDMTTIKTVTRSTLGLESLDGDGGCFVLQLSEVASNGSRAGLPHWDDLQLEHL